MRHIEWVDPDNIIIANGSSTSEFLKMTNDVQKNKITKIRLLENKNAYYFRYLAGSEICWFYLNNNESKNGTYYTQIYSLQDDKIIELNELYKVYDREDKINQLLK